jgi:hypothetical protein
MVLLDTPDWRPTMNTCVGALRPGGLFVYTLHHPVWTPGHPQTWARIAVVEVRDYLNEHDVAARRSTSIEVVEPHLRADQIEEPRQEILTRIPN